MTQIAKGLEGVLFTESKLTFINGSEGILTHLGIPIQEWAEKSTFEELSLALLDAELPTAAELAKFDAELKANRAIPREVEDLIRNMPRGINPMQALRTAVSYLGLTDKESEEVTPEARRAISIRLIAQFSTIIAAINRVQEGQDIIAPRADLTHAGNYLYMLNGKEPTPEQARLFDIALILHADHGMNASTFTAIATSSTISDMYSCIVSAIGALKGPLHGGANEAVLHVFDEIGDADNVVPWLDDALANKRKIMGFGHRVYKRGDSRVPTMKAALDTLVDFYDRPDVAALYDALESEFVGRKGIYPNLDYPSGPAYNLMGFDTLTFTPLFVAARIVGWTAHIIEQQSANALIRPLSAYNGPDERHVVGYSPDTEAIRMSERPEEAAE